MSIQSNIKILIDNIVKKHQLNQPKNWINRDYQILKSLIESKTGQQISERTIKRIIDAIYHGTDKYTPRDATLDIISQAYEYKSWQDFTTQNFKPSFLRVYGIKISILILLPIIVYCTFQLLEQKKINKITLSSQKQVMHSPDSSLFTYNIPSGLKDSVFLTIEGYQCIYDEMITSKIYLNPLQKSLMFYFKEPAIYSGTLTYRGDTLSSYKWVLLNKKWEYSIYNELDNSFGYKPIQGAKGIFSIDSSAFTQLEKSIGIRNKSKFAYFDSLPLVLDNSTIEMRVKNNYFQGLSCNMFKIYIHGSGGDIRLVLADKTCYDQTRIRVSDISVLDRFLNIEKLHHDFSEWTTIKVNLSKKTFTIYINDDESLRLPYDKPLGQSMGIVFWFLEGGAIDYVRYYNDKDSLVYNEEFN